jgi:hypothetical protein
MSMEQLLIYGAVALGGWILRHYGIGVPSVTPKPQAPDVITQVESIVKNAVAEIKQALQLTGKAS